MLKISHCHPVEYGSWCWQLIICVCMLICKLFGFKASVKSNTCKYPRCRVLFQRDAGSPSLNIMTSPANYSWTIKVQNYWNKIRFVMKNWFKLFLTTQWLSVLLHQPEDKAKYDGIFESLSPIGGLLSGDKVKPVLMNSNLPLDVLGKVNISFTL